MYTPGESVTDITDIRGDIDIIIQNHDIVNEDMRKLTRSCKKTSNVDAELDRLKSYSRRDNMIIYGIPEVVGEERSMTCKQTMLSTLNEHASFKKWEPSDVIRAHRLGVKRVYASLLDAVR